MKKTTTLNLQDFHNFIQMNNDVHWNYEEKYIEEFGNPEEDERDILNNWVREKTTKYLTEYFEELNKDKYSKEQLEEIKLLLSIWIKHLRVLFYFKIYLIII